MSECGKTCPCTTDDYATTADFVARALRERQEYLDALTSVQGRCDELLEEVRSLRQRRALAPATGGPHFDALNDMAAHVYEIAKSKGFHDQPVPVATLMANIHGEVSELWEAFRGRRLAEPCDKAETIAELTGHSLTCAEEELADILIRTLDTAQEMGIDIARAVRVKSSFNESRPHMHGGKAA
jgi:NTP pyrophosphatase (non-canonical NTP hydrolase)